MWVVGGGRRKKVLGLVFQPRERDGDGGGGGGGRWEMVVGVK
jgi:hypothetical protein